MAVPISNVVRRIVFAPSGVGPYAFTFEILAATDIEVYKGDTLLTLTTDYSVTINPNGTGSVTLVATAGTDNITIVGARAIQRATDFVTGGDLFANSLNTELDSLTIFAQQNSEGLARALQAPQTDPTTIDMTLPRAADRANKYLAFDNDGNPQPGDTAVDVGVVAGIQNNIVTVSNIAANVTTVAGISANVTTVAGISGNVTTVAGISSNVTTVAGNTTNINTVATDLAGTDNIGTVAGSIADVNALGPIAADISTVAGIDSDVTAVAADATDIGLVAGSIADVNAVAAIAADVASVAADATDIGTVAGGIANVTTVAGSIANVNTAASNISAITTVASDLNEPVSEIETVAGSIANIDALGPKAADISTVAGIAANVTTVAGISSNVTTVAGISANVSTVAGISADVTTVAADGADIGTVAGISADVTTVAGIAADVTAVAGVNTADLAAVAAIDTDVGTVAGIAANVTTVAGISADVTAVAGDATDIGTVATDLAGSNTIGTVAGIAANVTTVAGIAADVTTVAADGADIGAVAAIDSDVTTVAGIAANVTTVAGISANVTSVANNASNINQVAADTAAINAASTNATNAANSATAAAASAAAAAADAAAANAVSLGNEPVAPTIRPSLNLDFANVKALDPRITFTRTTTATYYDGKTTAKAEENLLKYSQAFTDASWTDTDCTVTDNDATAPDGTSTAATMLATNANAVLTQGYTAIAGSYTFSVWLRRVTGTGDIEIAADNGTWTTKVITGTWARYDVTQTVAAGSKTAGVRVVTDTDEIEVWGAQLEQRSAVTAYTPTTTQPITNYVPVLQTAASGVARFDHNPTTGESLGLLVEEQRTNLLTYSSEFDNAAWTKGSSSVTANTIVAPDGTLTGDKFISNSGQTGGANVNQVISKSAVATTYAYTCYAKAGEFVSFRLYFNDQATSANRCEATFNLSTGATSSIVSAGTFSNPSASMTLVGNGWYRCVLIGTSSTETSFQTRITNASSGQTGDGYSGIYLWGAQLEAGAFPTSYIPTVAASVTRNADAASMTGTNFSSWYRQDEGTFYVDWIAGQDDIFINPLAGGGATNTGSFAFRRGSSGNFTWGVTDTTTPQAFITLITGSPVSGTNYKTIGCYKVNNFAATSNGATPGTDTSGTVPSTIGTLVIGNGWNNSVGSIANEYLNSHVKKIAFYPARLSNAQLQALTTV